MSIQPELLQEKEPLGYTDVPFLEDLTPESKTALEQEKFSVTTMKISLLGSETSVPILTWEGIESNVVDLRELFGEPILEVNINPLEHSDSENFEQTAFISRAKYHLGDLTDAEFRERFFTNQDFFNQREVGQVVSSELAQSINQRLMGRLHAFYHANTNIGKAANLDLPAPGLQLSSRDHMVWQVGNLQLGDLHLTSSERRVARVAAILHDWGKVVMFRNGQHPEIGAAMARSILLLLHQQLPSLYPMELVNDVCWSISMHHLLERVFKPVKAEPLKKLSKKRAANRGLWPYQTRRRSAKKSENWFLYQAALTSLEKNKNEHVISVEQYYSFMEYLQTLAYYEEIPESQHALRELMEILRNPDEKDIGLLLAMVRVIEADLIATDRPESETTFRLNQLQLVLQGILISAEA